LFGRQATAGQGFFRVGTPEARPGAGLEFERIPDPHGGIQPVAFSHIPDAVARLRRDLLAVQPEDRGPSAHRLQET